MPELNTKKRTKAKTKKEVILPAVRTPVGLKKELRRVLRFMARTIRKRFENKVLKAMTKETVNKFQDAQKGSYATIFEKLSRDFEKSINKQFNKKRLKKVVEDIYSKTDKVNHKRFDNSVKNSLGLSVEKILKQDGLGETFIKTQTAQTVSQLEAMKAEMAAGIKQNTYRMMAQGATLDELYKQVQKLSGQALKRSDLNARNEIKNFNSQLSLTRARRVAKKGIWRNARDVRVRGNPDGKYPNSGQDHWSLEGKEFDLEKGIKDPRSGEMIFPGSKINCRCSFETVIDLE